MNTVYLYINIQYINAVWSGKLHKCLNALPHTNYSSPRTKIILHIISLCISFMYWEWRHEHRTIYRALCAIDASLCQLLTIATHIDTLNNSHFWAAISVTYTMHVPSTWHKELLNKREGERLTYHRTPDVNSTTASILTHPTHTHKHT